MAKLHKIQFYFLDYNNEFENPKELENYLGWTIHYGLPEHIHVASTDIGEWDDDRVIYDYDKMIDYLVSKENMTVEDAADFISYDTIRSLSYRGEDAPIVMFGIESYK